MRIMGPAFSVVASGTIGKLLTFSHRGLSNRVQLYRSHRDARSAAQVVARGHWTDGVRMWNLVSAADRAAHTYTYGAQSRTGFAAWMQQVVKRKHGCRAWVNPEDVGKAGMLGELVFWLAGRDVAEGGPWDISGHVRNLVSGDLDVVAGDRGSCWKTDADTDPTYVMGTEALGDLEELTVGIRILPEFDQGDMPAGMPIFQASSGDPKIGFSLIAFLSCTHWSVWNAGVGATAISYNLMKAGVWREWVCVFEGGDVKVSRIYIDGELDRLQSHSVANMGSNWGRVYVMRDPWVTAGRGTWHNAFVYKGVPSAYRI